MRKCWYPAFFPFFTMFSTPLRDQSHSLIHILFVLCRRFRLMSLKFYCLVIHISHKTENGCAWSKGSGERLQGHHGPLVSLILMTLGQNVRLDRILDEFKIGSCEIKNEVTRSNLRKTLCMF